MLIIHAKSAKKINNQDHLQERSKNQNGKLNRSHKTKNDKQNSCPKHKIQTGKTFHKRRIKNTVDMSRTQ